MIEELTTKEIEEIAKESNLNQEQTEALVFLIRNRFRGERSKSYVGEWAERIVRKKAFAYADLETTKVLKESGLIEWVCILS